MVDDGVEGATLLRFVVDPVGHAVEHDAAVVHRVVHRRAGQNEAVEQGDGDAHLGPGGRAQHGVPDGTVQVERVVDPPERHREHARRAVDHEAHVGDVGLVEDRVGEGAINAAAVGPTAHGRPGGRRQRLGHDHMVPVGAGAHSGEFLTAAVMPDSGP